MISRLGLFVARLFHGVCPDPFVISILLTALTAGLAIAFGDWPAEQQSLGARIAALLDAWRLDSGMWKLLAFGMQMCLILVTGHALAATRPVRAVIDALAARPRSTASAAALVCAAACVTALINWGLGLIVGALMAREVGRSLVRRGIAAHYPLLAAAGYMGLLVFHGGLSGSAPLSATTIEGARKVLPESAVALLGGGVGLERTLFSPLNLFVTGGLVMLLPLLFMMLAPKRETEFPPFADFEPLRSAPPVSLSELGTPSSGCSIPDRLDRSPLVVWLLAIPLLLALARYVQTSGVGNIQINEVNAAMLALGLILHGSPRAYMAAIEDGARDCGAIIIQFPIYAGIMAMMTASGLVGAIASGFTAVGDERTIPVLSFLAATVVGFFVPSGGGQWGVQGPIALQTGFEAGIDPGRMIMTVAYGDELANMLQPFWALPLLAITGVRARDIVGYTVIAMAVAAAWMTLGLLLF
jgi:short-chain fatty acids transporter